MSKNKEKTKRTVSRRVAEIVGKLAERMVVENLIRNVTHHSIIKGDLSDLAQIIYLALLETDRPKLEQLFSSGEIRYYIVRMIINQYYSNRSPFYCEIRKFDRKSIEISSQISDTYDAEKDYFSR